MRTLKAKEMFAKLCIYDFSEDNLKSAIIDESHSHSQKNKDHFKYLSEYLDEIGCKTIILESPYVDGDYLDDYSAYYVRCFKRYKRKCKRVHFFSKKINQDDLLRYLLEDNPKIITNELLQEHYLGFIVVKPLPEAFIGKTVLKTYASDSGRRNFPCKRDYYVGFFGTELKIRGLAFQEQDTVLAACATTALWCAFHKTADLFRSKLPTPAQITNAAAKQFLFGNRAFPSHGLNVMQMCQAIQDVGLEPELRDCNEVQDFSGFIMGYLSFGIPVILGIELQFPHSQTTEMHAVTIAGFSRGGDPSQVVDPEIPLKAHEIDKYYVHDDQIGPFSRISLDNPVKPSRFITGWKCKCGCGEFLTAIPKIILVPVYHKIRITYENVAKIVKAFHEFFDAIFKRRLVWEIQLAKVNQLKFSYLHNEQVYSEQRYKILMHNYPKYIWRAVLYIDKRRSLELVFDSTDIERAMFLDDIIICCSEVKDIIKYAIDVELDRQFFSKEYQDFIRIIMDNTIFEES